MGDADDPAACWSGPMSTATIVHNGSAADIAVSDRKRPRNGRVEHPTSAQRSATGKAARAAVPRSSLAAWEPGPGRRDPVDVLEEQAQTRVPELVPIRYGRMLVSPFTFYRGAAALMAADLAGSPRTRLRVQLCGDAHLSNFGAFAAPDRRLTFSVNDFDESLPGPFEWDVKRLAASFAVAGRDRGFDTKERETVNVAVGRSYRKAMRAFAPMRALDLWYARIDVEDLAKQWAKQATAKQRKRLDRNVAKARSKDSMRAFDRLTHHVDGHPRIISDSPLIVPIEELVSPERRAELEHTLRGVIRSYRRSLTADRRRLLERFQYVHAARKVVGVGSVGTRAWVVLMPGNDEADPLFLQLKEAEQSVLEPFLGESEFANHGQRAVPHAEADPLDRASARRRPGGRRVLSGGRASGRRRRRARPPERSGGPAPTAGAPATCPTPSSRSTRPAASTMGAVSPKILTSIMRVRRSPLP